MSIYKPKLKPSKDIDGAETTDAPVQRRTSNSSIATAAARTRANTIQAKGQLEGQDVHAVAANGVGGSGGALPHAETIQASFGSHDISAVSAHTGSEAAAANQSLGAQAYATGSSIAFATSSPDLHTTAHEAAHVIQQQGGVQLKGNVGQDGDRYEQHADTVADKVVAGESAQVLLDSVSSGVSGPAGGDSIQRLANPRVGTPPPGAVTSHTIVSGDTLGRVALANGASIAAVIEANPHIPNPDLVQLGDILYIPAQEGAGAGASPSSSSSSVTPSTEVASITATSVSAAPTAVPAASGRAGAPPRTEHAIHTVVSGDTFGAVANDRGIALAELSGANPHIPDPSVISPGDIIYIPLEPTIAKGGTRLDLSLDGIDARDYSDGSTGSKASSSAASIGGGQSSQRELLLPRLGIPTEGVWQEALTGAFNEGLRGFIGATPRVQESEFGDAGATPGDSGYGFALDELRPGELRTGDLGDFGSASAGFASEAATSLLKIGLSELGGTSGVLDLAREYPVPAAVLVGALGYGAATYLEGKPQLKLKIKLKPIAEGLTADVEHDLETNESRFKLVFKYEW